MTAAAHCHERVKQNRVDERITALETHRGRTRILRLTMMQELITDTKRLA